MGELSQRIIAKVSGPAWEQLRGHFMQIARSLLAVSPDADSELMTTYVKFTVHAAPQSRVFAAIWLKSSKRLIVGLALPEEYEAEELGPSLPGTMYKGLNQILRRGTRRRGAEGPCRMGEDGLSECLVSGTSNEFPGPTCRQRKGPRKRCPRAA